MLAQYLVHLGYALQLCALLARDVLWLRAILVAAQSVLAYYAYTRGLWPYVFWNLLFVAINVWWVVRLLRERAAVKLPAELRPIHESHFAALTPPEFMRLWHSGQRASVQDRVIVHEGSRPETLYYVLSGEVEILRGERVLARVGPGGFVAEMSVLTGEPATATAVARGPVAYMAWPVQQLHRIRSDAPATWTRFQSVLGHEVVEKLRRAAG